MEKMEKIDKVGKIRKIRLPKLYLFYLLYLFSISAQAQKTITLQEVLNLSKNSAAAVIAKHEFLCSHWEYISVKTIVYPEFSLNGTLPNFTRSISKITQPDGTDKYLSQFNAGYSGSLQISQNIPLTGGQITLKSGLERMDMYGTSASTSFLSTPIQLGFRQSLFSYNSMKWSLRINPVRYNLAKQKYIEAVEKASVQAVSLYFDLLLFQNRLHNAEQNFQYADSLKYIAEQKFKSGKMVETEYLQIELNALQSALQAESFKNDWRNAMSKLKQFLQLNDNEVWELSLPDAIFNKEISVQNVHLLALENPLYQDFKVRELQTTSNLMRAKRENRFSVDLYATFGLTQNAIAFKDVYKNPIDQEIVSLGLRIPFLDFGRAKSRIKIAESQQEITRLQISQERQTFEQALELKVLQFNTQKTQVELSGRALTIAYKRLQAQKDSYTLGKSTFTDLTNATTDKDNAVITYLEILKSYWITLYEIRQITLYDFEKDNKIEVDFKTLVR
jgi:outer membrane protein TolC